MVRRLLLFCCVGLVIVAQDRPVGRGVNFYSPAKEQALGAQLAETLSQQTTKVDSASVQEYVDRVGQRIAAQSPGDPATKFRFTVIEAATRENPTHEPVALPGGYIFVPVPLILAAQDENEFAGMLAHAIGHIAARHGTRTATRSEIANMASIPLVLMTGAGNAMPFGFAKFQRQFESEADRLAVQMMAMAGFDPAGLVRYIARVQPPDQGTPSVGSPMPVRDVRVRDLEVPIQETHVSVADGNADEFKRVQDSLRRPPPSLR